MIRVSVLGDSSENRGPGFQPPWESNKSSIKLKADPALGSSKGKNLFSFFRNMNDISGVSTVNQNLELSNDKWHLPSGLLSKSSVNFTEMVKKTAKVPRSSKNVGQNTARESAAANKPYLPL